MLGKCNVPGPAGDGNAAYMYEFGPFRVESEILIPELEGFAGAAYLPVRVKLGHVPEGIEGGVRYGRDCEVSASEYLLKIRDVGSFHVTGGNTVLVEKSPDAPAPDVSTFLLGSVFGALCHQNGMLPLHASSVRSGAGVTAFLGDSGAGKSTMAACLHNRGHGIVSDDICLLAPEAATGEMRVIPVAGWLKLWRASLNYLGASPDEKNRVYSEDDKYRLYLETHAGDRPALRNLVFLTRVAGGEARLEALSTAETLAGMMHLTYLGYITELTGSHARVFRQCAQVLAGAKGYRLVVPWGFEGMDGVLDLLERDLLTDVAG